MNRMINTLFAGMLALALGPLANAFAASDQVADKQSDSGSASSENQASEKASDAKQAMSDATITTKVKSKLLADKSTHGLSIKVDTKGGVVSLSGEVKSKAESDAAEKIAHDTNGVKSVDNKLTVQQG